MNSPKKYIFNTLFLCGLFSLTPISYAQDPIQITRKSTQSTSFTILSAYTHQQYQIDIYFPPSSNLPSEGYHVLYLLDGNAVIESAKTLTNILTTSSKSSANTTPVALVSIGYISTKNGFNTVQRALDYTPTPNTQQYARPPTVFGGAQLFSKFIEKELQPRIEHEYFINTQAQGIYGHSLGGLFVLNLLSQKDHLFNRFIAASPSIWFNQYETINKPFKLKNNQMLMITFGSNEGAGPSGDTVHHAKEMRDKLFSTLKNKDNTWTYIQPGDQHIMNLYSTLPKAILLTSCNSLVACHEQLDPQ